jgi:hypothetical protein
MMLTALLTLIATTTLANNLERELDKNGLSLRAPPQGYITDKTSHLGSYVVTGDGDDVAIRFVDWAKEHGPITLEVEGVKIEGTNRGEWGGKLTVTSDGKTVTLLEENVVSIQQANNSIFVFVGLAHMGRNDGAMYELSAIKTAPQLTRVTLLPSAPQKVVFDNGTAYILTYDGLVSVNPSNDSPALEIIAYNAPWFHFAPNSLIKQGGRFFIGMHAGVTVIDIDANGRKEVKFYGTQGIDIYSEPEPVYQCGKPAESAS